MKMTEYNNFDINKRLKTLTDQGVSDVDAISKVASVDKKNPYKVANTTDIDVSDDGYQDIVYHEGSNVKLSGSSEEYEVINIRNRDNITLRNLKDNSRVVVSDEKIIPILENKMKKLNEANYNLSIDGLQTTDAETLSQMLSLAGQAENGGEIPMDTMDIVPEQPIEDLGDNVIDVTDAPVSEPEDINMDFGMEEYEQTGIDEDFEHNDIVSEDKLFVPPEMPDMPEISKEEEQSENEEELIKEDDIDNITIDTDIDSQIAEALRLAGVELNEVSEEKATEGKKDLPTVPVKKANPDKHFEEEPIADGERGLEASKGFEKNPMIEMKIGKMVNADKIKSICETATRMYAKKDSKDWLALDRRYIEKLILSGVGYSSASKMLLKAKAGK